MDSAERNNIMEDNLISEFYSDKSRSSKIDPSNTHHYSSYEIIGTSSVNRDMNNYNAIDYDIGNEGEHGSEYLWISAGFGPCSASCLGNFYSSYWHVFFVIF